MIDLSEQFASIATLSFSRKAKVAKNAFFVLMEEFSNLGIEAPVAVDAVHALIAVAVSGDRKVGASERKLYHEVFGEELSGAEFRELVLLGNQEETIRNLDRLIDYGLSDEGKEAAVALTCCFMGSDGLLTEREKDIFEKLLR